jgi:transcriptional regulator with XRE-family HTH domain
MSGLTVSSGCPTGAALRESPAIENARRALGTELAACRRAAGHNQAALAELVGYSRSTIANVETGRQNVPRDFWERADAACHAGGTLIESSNRLEIAVRREHEDAARQARSVLLGPAGVGSGAALAAAGSDSSWLDEIAAAASEARGHAERDALTGVGPGTLDQLTADVVRLSRAYVTAPPLPLFATMHHVLGRIDTALDQHLYPAQARELNFLAGVVCGLMANACLDLGREEAADDLARAAWTHGRIVDHGPLMGWARGTQALAAIWDERYADAAEHADDGLHHVPDGTGAVRLHAISARALAATGDRAAARAAVKAAEKAHENEDRDELHDGIAGEFAFDEPKLRYYEALSLLDADDPAQAGPAAADAVRLYQAVPARARSYGCEALARVQLAKAHLMSNEVDGAADALRPVIELDPQRRISSLNQHLETCRELLQAPAHGQSGTARRLGQELAAFSAASTARALPRTP